MGSLVGVREGRNVGEAIWGVRVITNGSDVSVGKGEGVTVSVGITKCAVGTGVSSM